LHHRYGNRSAEDLVSKVAYANKSNVFFSPFKTLPMRELSRLLSAVDIGIAFYRPDFDHPSSGKNLSFIGMASGKLSTYLQHGVPVLVNELGEISTHVRKYGLGRVVNHGRDIPATLEQLESSDRSSSSERCYRFFEDHLDCNLCGQRLVVKIKTILN